MAVAKRKNVLPQPTLTLWITFFSFAVIGMVPGILNIAWTYMQDTFAITGESLGLLLTAATTGRLLVVFFSGRVIDRFGLFWALLLACALGMSGLVAIALAPTFTVLLIAFFVASMGNGVIDVAVNAFASSYYSKGPMNWLHASFGVGLTISPFLVTFQVVQLGLSWRWGYALMIVIYGILALTFLLTRALWVMPVAEEDTSAEDGIQGNVAPLLGTLLLPGMILGLVFFAVYGNAEIGTGQLLNTLLIEGREFDEGISGSWVSFYWGTFTVGRIVAGSIGDRISDMMLKRLGLSMNALGLFLLWLNPHEIVAFIGLAITGFGLAPLFAIFIAETPGRVGAKHTTNAIGFQIGIAGLGGALLVGFGGSLAERIGPESIAAYLLVNAFALIALQEWLHWRDGVRATRKRALKPEGTN